MAKQKSATALQTISPNACHRFFDLGMQYYIAARFSAKAGLMPIAGNLYHHALEMFLKGGLSRSLPLATLKSKTYGHKLIALWDDFKVRFPSGELVEYDSQISELDKFESIRYPDAMLKSGMVQVINWKRPDNTGGQTFDIGGIPVFGIVVKDMDALIAKLFALCSINPKAVVCTVNESQWHTLHDDNSESAIWKID